MKIGLQAKFVILFLIYSGILFVLQWVLIVFIGVEIYSKQYEEYLSEIEDIAIHELRITPEELAYYAKIQEKDERYHEIFSYLQQLQGFSRIASLYITYSTDEGQIYLFDTSKDGQTLGAIISSNTDSDYIEWQEALDEVYISHEKRNYFTSYEGDRDSGIITVLTPFSDMEGEVFAVLGADVYMSDIALKLVEEMRIASILLLMLTAMGMAVLLLFVHIVIVRAIRKLKQGVQKMMEGELGVEVPSRRKDEIGEITRIFNRMSAVLKGHMSEMEELNRAYQKFVPREMLEILHKGSVVEVEFGNQAQERMAILSIEAYAFDEITQELSSEETFQYINNMLKVMVPAATAQGGIIAQFDKAGICSFYRGQTSVQSAAQSALSSALQICERSEKKEFAAGIAQGTVMVGIAGHSERMNIISISGEKKLSEFLMQLAPKYRASVLISEQMQKQIPSFAESYHARFLGYLKFSRQLVGVYDVFDSDMLKDRRFKQMTKEQFEQGVTLFLEGNYTEARQMFVGVLRQYRRDEAAKIYIHRCSCLLEKGESAAEIWLEEFS